jgi:Arm DNA-binding domain
MPKVVPELSPAKVRLLMNTPGLHAVGGVTGLFLQVKPGRTDPDVLPRSWILRATVPSGARRDIGLGSFPTVTLQRAREKARAMRNQIDDGLDPVDERRKAKTAARVEKSRSMTFAECAKAYEASHAHDLRPSNQRGIAFVRTGARHADHVDDLQHRKPSPGLRRRRPSVQAVRQRTIQGELTAGAGRVRSSPADDCG